MPGMPAMGGAAPAANPHVGHGMPGMAMPAPPAQPAPGRAMQGMSGMADGMDLNDVDFDAYLANDRTLDDPEVVRIERGGRVRLRIINGAAATVFFIDLGALEGRLVAVDGNPVEPVVGRRFGMAMAQRLDIELDITGTGAWPILAQREGDTLRTGIVLASPGAAVTRVAERAASAAGAFGLELERQLRALAPLAPRPADRTQRMTLTGDMASYSWTIDNRTWDDHVPLVARRGERVEWEIANSTMMAHPMHLHGHHFQVIAIDGQALRGALRDTIHVPPRTTVRVAFDADNPGRWLIHCHNALHMVTGMMTELRYET
jgi:FtsP/CotA-like multicopper oxidase with cupredoxin domain